MPEPSKMPVEHHSAMTESETKPKSRNFGVAASPFNGIKVELGFAIIFGTILWLAADSITANEGTQGLILLGYGLLSMLWLVLRTRAVLRRYMKSDEISHETHK